MTDNIRYVVRICEDEFAGTRSFSEPNADVKRYAYASGFSDGGNKYGAGSCFVYMWPEDAGELKDDLPDAYDEAVQALGSPSVG